MNSLLLHTTFDLELDREIGRKALSGMLTKDEKEWIATYNSLWGILGDLALAIGGELGQNISAAAGGIVVDTLHESTVRDIK